MVLISHKYKFIYIKNVKVAGTSVESFFEKYCMNPDKKYVKSERINTKISKYGIIGFRGIQSELISKGRGTVLYQILLIMTHVPNCCSCGKPPSVCHGESEFP